MSLKKRNKIKMRKFNLFMDPVYSSACSQLNIEVTKSKKANVQTSRKKCDPLTPEIIGKMVDSLNQENPTDILMGVTLMVGITCCVRGGQSLRDLTWEHFKFVFDSNNVLEKVLFKRGYSKSNTGGLGHLKKVDNEITIMLLSGLLKQYYQPVFWFSLYPRQV